MPCDPATGLAKCGRGLVVAPAGCGKTHLIAESVGCASGKQLVLTHTHAGVDALRTKLKALGVPSSKYHVTTIDSLALCYANAFPSLAGWECDYPRNSEEWRTMRAAACRLFECRAPRRVLRASYAGIFVDEYQDCCGTQHAMIEGVADVLPCRIVGDPLQAIYRKLHGNDIAKWSEVEQVFPIVYELTEPHRWQKQNPELGTWLSHVRSRLVKGKEVDFASANGIVEWIPSADEQNQIAACYKSFDKCGLVAICDWPARCVKVASKTRNHFTVLESVECPDLLQAAEDIENSSGFHRVANVVDLARRCFTGMSVLDDLLGRMRKGLSYNPRSQDKVYLWDAMQNVERNTDFPAVENMMTAVEGLSSTHFYKRRELWHVMKRTLRGYDTRSDSSMRESAWRLRDHSRRHGQRILSKRIVATPLLIKGLEFNHALLLDARQMGSAEELYVALTRGTSSLTVLSSDPKVVHSPPAWMRESSSRD